MKLKITNSNTEMKRNYIIIMMKKREIKAKKNGKSLIKNSIMN